MSAKAFRSTASEMAFRSSSRWIHGARGSPANAPGLQVEPQRVGVDGNADVEQLQAARVGRALHRRIVLEPDLPLREVGLPRLQAEELCTLVRNDFDDDAIQQRELRAGGVLAEVARVACEHQALPRRVLGEHERAEPRNVGEVRARAPGRREARFGGKRLDPVLRQDRQVVEEPEPGAERSWKRHDDGRRVDGFGGEVLPTDAHRVGHDAPAFFVVGRRQRKHHVVGGERDAVCECDSRTQLDRVAQAVGRRRPAFREPRFHGLRDPVDADQPGLGQHGHEVGRRVMARIPVERLRVRAEGDDEIAAARGRRLPGRRRGRRLRAAGNF